MRARPHQAHVPDDNVPELRQFVQAGAAQKPSELCERRNYAYTRLELVDKDELFPQAATHPSYHIGAYTFGGVRDLVQNQHWQVGLGADVAFYSKPAALDPVYGDSPVSFHVFLRVRPGLSHHGH